MENGKTTYEVEMMVHGHTKDGELDPSGAVVEIEEEAAMDSLPANVKAGLTAKAAGGKILKVETLTKGSKLVAYEAKVQSAAGQKSEIQVGPDANHSITKNRSDLRTSVLTVLSKPSLFCRAFP